MLWRVAALALTLVIVLASYVGYCRAFWDDYYADRPEGYSDFRPAVPLPQDTALEPADLPRYTWTRTSLEPEHGQWVNETELRFPNDSTMEVTVRPGYVQDNYWLYPILRRLVVLDRETHEVYAFDRERMTFPSRWSDGGPDSISVELNSESITIDYSFL